MYHRETGTPSGSDDEEIVQMTDYNYDTKNLKPGKLFKLFEGTPKTYSDEDRSIDS